MKLHLPLIIFIYTILSCNTTDTTDPALQQEPYTSLTDSIQQQPNDAHLYYKRGALLLRNNQLNYAEKDLKKAWSLEPTETNALGVITVLQQKNTDSVIAFTQQAMQKLPQSIPLKLSLAKALQQKNNIPEALSATDAILQQYPNAIDALLLKAELLKAQQKNKEALQTLEAAYSYAPFDAELAHSLAFEWAQAKNPKVLALTDSLIKLDSAGRHAEPYYFKGIYNANIGNNNEALDNFNEALQRDYYFLDAYMDKGALLYNQQRYELALQTFRLATTVSPTFADAYYWQGKTNEALGKKEEALQDYDRAYALDNNLADAQKAAQSLRNK